MGINFNILNTIKSSESNHTLNILVLNDDQSFDIHDIINLSDYGNTIVTAETPLQSSQLIGKVNGLNIKIVLSRRIPIKSYDLVIANNPSDLLYLIISNLTIKYLYILNKPNNFKLSEYHEFLENTYKLTTITTSNQNIIDNETSNTNVVNDDYEDDEDISYDIFIKNIATTPIKYDEYRINYLAPAVPGKVSIIMIVSALNNNFAEVIRYLKSQEYPLIEFIIIDNAAGFRNNVKPNIRYGTKMDIDFCEYHAKELCTGEYMIILHEDSESFVINDYIEQGKYQVR